jgi:hypothetical protein
MDTLVLGASLPIGFALSYYFGYGGLAFVLVAVSAASLLFFSWIATDFHIRGWQVQQTWTRGEPTILNLTDKSPHREKGPPPNTST